MKTQHKRSGSKPRKVPKKIKVIQRIRLLVHETCAAHGGEARMTLSGWHQVEAEVTQHFDDSLRVCRRWIPMSCSYEEQCARLRFHLAPTREFAVWEHS